MSFTLIRAHLVGRRTALRRSQQELADAMGTTQSAVSDLETGRTKDPCLGTVSRWAAALDLAMTVQFAEVLPTTIPVFPAERVEPRTAAGHPAHTPGDSQ